MTHRSPRRGGVGATLLVAAVALAAATGARTLLARRTAEPTSAASAAPTAGAASLAQLDSYALGLLLGGLRGPLVMTLWSTSENQKADRDLSDIDTKIELIRLLQPQFDGVHLFQIWNKAYNLSVQKANLPAKYADILDAVEYARDEDRARPNNINIVSELGRVYGDKLGNSAEATYYVPRLREESLPPQPRVRVAFPTARRDDFVRAATRAGLEPRRYALREEDGGRQLSTFVRGDFAERLEPLFAGEGVGYQRGNLPAARADAPRAERFDTILDADGNLLPALVAPNPARAPAGAPPDPAYALDGSELGFLEKFEPFPYGVSPNALAYNYHARAYGLQQLGQRHAQLADRVLSTRVAHALREWAEEEMVRGRTAEASAQFAAVPLSLELPNLELLVADVKADQPIERTPLVDEAIDDYRRGARVAAAASAEFEAHVRRYPDDQFSASGQYAWCRALTLILQGDAAFLQLQIEQGADRRAELAREASDAYLRGRERLYRHALQFYVGDWLASVALPTGYTRADAGDRLPAADVLPAMERAAARAQEAYDRNDPTWLQEVGQYRTIGERLTRRLADLNRVFGTAVTPAPTTLPAATNP